MLVKPYRTLGAKPALKKDFLVWSQNLNIKFYAKYNGCVCVWRNFWGKIENEDAGDTLGEKVDLKGGLGGNDRNAQYIPLKYRLRLI